jgi:hypothetical protein
MNEQDIKNWIERNPDIPVHAIKNAPCMLCGRLMWTESGLLHWCIK